MKPIQVLADGGGIQSTAIKILIIQGILPKPDHIITSDTGRERSTTWDYMQRYSTPVLREIGIEPVRLIAKDWCNAEQWDYMRRGSDGCWHTRLPVYTINDGKDGKHIPHCSDRWKKAVMRRYLRRLYGFCKDVKVETWLGITLDEAHRVRDDDVLWNTTRHPLIEGWLGIEDGTGLALTRNDCKQIIRDFGWPLPEKSSCYICPHMKNHEWQTIQPWEFRQAVKIERRMHRLMEKTHYLAFLHKDRKPLEQCDFCFESGADNACPYCFN